MEYPIPVENSALDEIIGRINKKGPITFAEFMDVALYREGGGYYMSARDRWGKKGDYITNLDVSPIFSRMLAKQIHQMWQVIGEPDPFYLVEAGAGRGYLTEGIADTVSELYGGFSKTLKICLVEKNPFLRKPGKKGFAWYEDISRLKHPVTGCIYSQELLDALPFHRVVEREDGLKEIYVGYKNAIFVDVEDKPSKEGLAEYFRDLGISLFMGQRAEVNLSAKEWIGKAGALLKEGFVLTIDYGMPASLLYREGMMGTLLCHYRHTMNDDPYRMVGMQDITCHVDFTTLKNEGIKSGLMPAGFTTQRNFLLGLGILEELREAGGAALKDYEAISFNQGIKKLVMPGDIGDVMKVFIQGKGVKEPRLLGFSFVGAKEGP